MTTQKNKPQTAFGQAALLLDEEFARFERLAREIERLSFNSDKGLERARTLMKEIDACRERMEASMHALSRGLDESRASNEAAVQLVAERAMALRERERETEQMVLRFKTLAEMVKKVSAAVAQLKRPSAGEMSPEDQKILTTRLPEINASIDVLIEEARKLMEDAHARNLKEIERNADSLRQSLQSARRKLNLLVDGKELSQDSSEAAP